MILVRKAEIRYLFFFEMKKINETVATNDKLTNNFADVVTCGLGPDLARVPPVYQSTYTILTI